MQQNKKVKLSTKINLITYWIFSIVIIAAYIIFTMIFKTWKNYSFFLNVTLISLFLFFFFNFSFIIWIKKLKNREVPVGLKTWEYVLFYFNDRKIPTTKELTDKNIRNLKTFVSVFYVLQVIYVLGTIGTVFVSLLVAAENKEIFNISSFVCSVFLFFNTTFLILLRKVCQVYIGTNRQKQKSDWLFFFY